MSVKIFKKFSIKEFVFYCLFGGLALWGLTYMILGTLAKFLPIPESQNMLKLADDTIASLFGLGYLGWGLILFGVFGVALAITMIVFAKDVDKNFEKNQRRAARLQRNKVDTQPEVVDAEVK